MSRIVRLVPLCSLSVTLLAAPAQAEPRKPTHVACVGDSITAGAGASSADKNYVEQLKGLLGNGVQTLNFGVSGTTMLSAPYGDNPYTLSAQYTPSTTFVTTAGAGALVSVVIILGANDSKPFNWDPAAGKNDQQYKKDYLALVDHYLGLTPKPVVYAGYPLATGTNPCCSIRGNVIHDEELPLIKQVAMEKHLPIIDLNTPTTGHPEYFGDGVHPNDAGYVVMAGLVKKGLEREPTVSITSPTIGAMVSGAMVPLTADASADYVDITSVEFFEGATSLGKATAKPYTVNWAAPLGAHKVTAKVIDATLANATSTEVAFTVAAGGGGSAGSAGSGGSDAAGTGGASGGATGGTAAAGASTGGTAATTGGTATGGAPGTAGASGACCGPDPIGQPDAGCSCSTLGSRGHGGALGWLLLGSVLSLAGWRRRAA